MEKTIVLNRGNMDLKGSLCRLCVATALNQVKAGRAVGGYPCVTFETIMAYAG